MTPRRRRILALLVAGAAVALASAAEERWWKPRLREGSESAVAQPSSTAPAKSVPVAVPPTAACLPLQAGLGPLDCPYPPSAPAPDIDWGAPFERGHRCVSAGLVHITSGKLNAADPLVYANAPPFDPAVPNGDARVYLSLSDDPDTRDLFAFALVAFANEKPVRWESQGTHAVDAGAWCFADGEALALASKRDGEARDGEHLYQVMQALGFRQRDLVNLCLDPERGTNLVIFRSGLGDGVYETYFGYDARGRVTAALTNFRLLDLGKGLHPFLEAP